MMMGVEPKSEIKCMFCSVCSIIIAGKTVSCCINEKKNKFKS